ncbi:MAG: response regulator [Bacteroidia bacterium]
MNTLIMQNLNVLLVDDSALLRERVKELIAEVAGVQKIETAATLPEACEIVQKGYINAVVLDIQLPDGNGLDFLKWIKFLYPAICVIMFSNSADECHRAIAKNSGAEYFFDKSREFQKLPVALAELINL